MNKMKKKSQVDSLKRSNKLFTEMPIWKSLGIMALPSMLLMLVFGSYFFTDSILSINFAQDSYQDANGDVLAAYSIPGSDSSSLVRLIMNGFSPINTLMVALGLLFGMGISTRVSISRGKGDLERAKNTMRTGMMIGLSIALILVPILVLSAKPWIGSQYAGFDDHSKNIIQNEAFKYGWPIIISFPFMLFNNVISSLLRTEARNKQMLIALVLPIFLNIFLDWVMMGPGEMGVEGGAWATAISNVTTTILLAIFILASSKESLIKFKTLFGLKFKILSLIGIVLVGIAPFLRNISQSITAATQTNVINEVSTKVFFDNYLASWHQLSPLQQKVELTRIFKLVHQTAMAGPKNSAIYTFWAGIHQSFGGGLSETSPNLIPTIVNNAQPYITPDVLKVMPIADAKNVLSGPQYLIHTLFMGKNGMIEKEASIAMISIMSGCIPVFVLFFPVMYAFAQGARPIASFNYGAKNYKRVKQIYWWTVLYAFIAAIIIYFFVAWGISGWLLDLLKISNTPLLESKDFAVTSLKIIMLSMVVFPFAIAGMVMFGSTDRVVFSVISSSMQGLILFFPLLYSFREIAINHPGNDLMFLWMWPLSMLGSSIIITFMVVRLMKTLDKKDQLTLEERITKINVWLSSRFNKNNNKKTINRQ